MLSENPAIPLRLERVALEAARAGLRAVRAVTVTGSLNIYTKSGVHDLVTDADQAADAAIANAIRGLRPDDAILTEENGLVDGTSTLRWVVDPIDGTANYVYRRLDWAISVGVKQGERPIAGAVIRSDGRWVTGGAEGVRTGSDRDHFGDAVSALRQTQRPAEAILGIGLPHNLTKRQLALRYLTSLVPYLRGIRVVGSAATELAAVALGECDAYLGFALAEWDSAAGESIVKAAGGVARHDTLAHELPVLGAGNVMLVDAITDLVRAQASNL